jgi:tRNA 2-thiouridine synthesizing protein A
MIYPVAEVLDLRGLRCPLVLVRAREALGPDGLVVLASDREAPIDLAALAADRGMACAASEQDGVWRIVLEPLGA